ncbi:MAG: NUDIX hydrolase [Candidatus Saccharimonadales bacterium]|jgi:ADP-ribose pyrophosphatase YjhB (NUDIX family)
MPDHQYPLSKTEFDSIYSKVPRLTVEVIVKNKNGAIFLTKRAIEPCKGQWHLPGGTVYFGELLFESVKRIAAKELNIKVLQATNKGYIEYPSHYLNGLDSPVGIVFEVSEYEGKLQIDSEALDGGWFTKLPDNIHADQDEFLLKHKYLKS